MTPSDAALREAIEKLAGGFPRPYEHEVTVNVDDLLALFQSEKQQLLAEILEKQAYHRCEGGWFEYVPLAVLERYQKQGKGGE